MMDEDRGSSLKSLEMGVGPGLEMVGQKCLGVKKHGFTK